MPIAPAAAAAPAHRSDPLPAVLLALTGTTGLVDAGGIRGLGHVFTANMTGNVVFLGFAAAGARCPSAPRCSPAGTTRRGAPPPADS